MKNLIYLPWALLIGVVLPAQGLVLEDEIYDALPQLAPLEGQKDSDFPAQVDLSAYCPSVRNQGDVFSCVGWAVGYGALTIKRAIKNQTKDKASITEQAYSAMFIYNQIKGETCTDGARISDALKLLRHQGDCLASQFDSDIEDCYRQPSRDILSSLHLDTIAGYLALFDSKTSPSEKIKRVVRALANQEPVIVGMNVRKNFYQLHKAKYWWPDLGNTSPAGGHAMVVVGYDNASASFLLFNSWGKQWGDEGYIRIKYEDFANFCKYAFIIQLPEQLKDNNSNLTSYAPSPLRTLSGNAAFHYLDATAQEAPLFRHAKVSHQGSGVYTCDAGAWPVGQLFQLAAWARQSGLYLYVFSVSPDRSSAIHWPRAENLNTTFAGLNESALLLDSDVKAIIPGADKALRLHQAGTDVLYVLFATQPILHPDFIAAKMEEANGQFRQKLEALLGRHLVPLPDISFSDTELSFEASTRHSGYIVPLILELQAR
ncbi:MAG TPA: C1 family peptidase [Saprospiraceae bacterium]|nr:C1 family peptidase [Saprospiraceae bacterium]HMQ83664.1 C1 family peptidase [Saprospiraceae bacterium]